LLLEERLAHAHRLLLAVDLRGDVLRDHGDGRARAVEPLEPHFQHLVVSADAPESPHRAGPPAHGEPRCLVQDQEAEIAMATPGWSVLALPTTFPRRGQLVPARVDH